MGERLQKIIKSHPSEKIREMIRKRKSERQSVEIARKILDENRRFKEKEDGKINDPFLIPMEQEIMGWTDAGDPFALYEAGRMVKNGHPIAGALMAGATLLPGAIGSAASKRVAKKFVSELDWSPEGWFSKRASGKWTKEDAEELAKHVNEYHEIERLAKENGTWLKNADGSDFVGDPRVWVMSRSKNAIDGLEPETWYSGILGNSIPDNKSNYKNADDYVQFAKDTDSRTAYRQYEEFFALKDAGASEKELDDFVKQCDEELRAEYRALPDTKEDALRQLELQKENWTGPVWGSNDKRVANGFGTVSQMEFRIPKQENIREFDYMGHHWNDNPYDFNKVTGEFEVTPGKDYYERISEKNSRAFDKGEYYPLHDPNDLVNMSGSDGLPTGGHRIKEYMPFENYTRIRNIREGSAPADDLGEVLLGPDGKILDIIADDIVIAPNQPRVFLLGNNGALTGIGGVYRSFGGTLLRQYACGGKKYPDGGKFFRTNLQQESPMMYQPMMPSYPDVPVPMKYEPLPNYGSYEYPASTGMMESMPIATPSDMLASVHGDYVEPVPVEPAVDLFTDEAIARRALKQRYAESAFNDKARSKAGAQGAWQIMPITLKDYLGRGRGKAGDLNDPEYNRKVRDWVMDIIPRDLQEFWSDSDSDRAKLAKLYAAYNWGAGNLRGFLRKKQKAGVDISNPDNWVDDLNPETRRYVKYLAFDEDIPDSTVYTNAAFERAAADRGFAGGGRIHIKPENRGKFNALLKRTGKSASWFKEHGTPLQRKRATFALNARKWKHGDGGLLKNYFEDGGPDKQNWFTRATLGAMMAENPAVATASGWTRDADGNVVQTEQDNPGVQQLRNNLAVLAGTSYAAPLMSAAPAAVNWLSNPANQILAAKFAVPMLGAEAVNSAVRNYTPYNSWGEGLYSPFRRFNEKYLPGIPNWVNETGEFLADFTNPGFVVAPYAGEISRNIGKGVKDLYKWGKFVTGNGEEYADGLRRMKVLQDEAEAVHNDVAELQRSALSYPGFYELPVQPNTVELAGGKGTGIESETLFDFSPYAGSNIYRIPQYVDELGSSGNATLTYPVAATPVTRNHVNAMKLPYSGSPNIFDRYDSFLDASGNSWHYPYDPFPRVDYKYVGDNGLTTSLLKYDAGSGSSIPVQRGVAGGGKKIAESMAHTESLLGDSGFVSGSTRFYAEDMLSGVPKDTEIVTTQGKFNDVLSKLGIKNPTKINDFAYEGSSMSLPNSGKVDIQIIEQNSAGEANGSLSWSLFKTMHPKEYHQLVNDYAYGQVGSMSSKIPFKDMPVINPSTGKAYTPDELYAEFTSGDFKMQQLVNDAMGMNKNIRDSFVGNPKDNLLKHNRPLSFLTNKDPRVKALVRRALDTNAEAELGDNFVHGTKYFPSIDFTNVAENEAFLKSFGINPKGIADDPEMMSNIFDAWFLPESTQVRVVSGMRGKDAVRKALFEGNHSYGGGSAAGSGLNTLEGGVSDLAFPYSQTGFMQNLPSYGAVRDDITSPMAAKNLVTRLNRKSMLSADEQSALKKELNSIISDLQAQHAPSNVMNTLNSIKLKMGTTQSLVRFDEHLTMIGDYIPDPYAEEIIDRWTRAIDLPGMKTNGYGGTYYGKFRKGAPSATSVKVIDPYAKYGDRNPFEVGRNLRTYSKNNSGSSSSYTGVGVERAVSSDQIPVEGRDIAASMINPYANMMTPEQLDALGAEFTPNPDVARFRERTQKLLDQKWEHGLISEELKRLEELPMSSRAIRKAEEKTGLRRDKFVRDSKVTEFIPSSVKREMLKDAPFDTKNLRILGFKPMPAGYEINIETGEQTKMARDGFMVQLTDGTEYEVTKQVIDGKTKWIWEEYVLPFAKGGFMNRLKSVYRDDNDKIRQAIANARFRQKK